MGTYWPIGEVIMSTTEANTQTTATVSTPARARSISAKELFNLPKEPVPQELCRYSRFDQTTRQIFSDTITIVMNRDIRRNTEIASGLALHLAVRYPQRRVLLINTYAGTALMQRTLAEAAWRECFGTPKRVPEAILESFEEARTWQQPQSASGDGASEEFEFPENFRVLNAPTGFLTAAMLATELAEYHADTVIVNSFEYSAWSAFLRGQFAHSLIALQRQMKLTVVVFSHEMRYDLSDRRPGRGAIGVLAGFAFSIWRLEDSDDPYCPVRPATKRVNEKQTQMRATLDKSKEVADTPFSDEAARERARERERERLLKLGISPDWRSVEEERALAEREQAQAPPVEKKKLFFF